MWEAMVAGDGMGQQPPLLEGLLKDAGVNLEVWEGARDGDMVELIVAVEV